MTLGFACAASAGLPVFYGNTNKWINGKKTTLFDGGMLYNPYLPQNIEYPIIYSNFLNSVNYQKYIPFLQKPADAAMEVSDVIITTPVGNIVILASNEEVENLVETGYNEAKKVLYKK